MSDIVVKKLKKYVLYISTIFFVALGSHLTYSYLYDGAESEPIEGGTISEAIIGSFPHFNPLVPTNDHNAYINELLYRSMLQYSTKTKNFETDLVSCNLESLIYIECVLETNLKWSDESEITTDDIKATLEIIKQTKVNPILASLLEGTTIETTKDSISFRNEAKDINFLEIFSQPILPKRVIEKLDTENIDGKFSEINGVYSGRFVLTSISQDETVGITKIALGKNANYFGNNMYIELLILNLFQDEAHFLKNKNSFNIFNDKDGIVGNTIPRLEVFKYTMPQFVTSFLNTETLDNELRSFVSEQLDRENIVKEIGEERFAPAFNPFLSDISIDGSSSNFSLSSYLKEKWYTNKSELIAEATSKAQDIVEATPPTTTAIISDEATLFSNEDTRPVQEDLEYINSPTTKKYNFTSQDGMLLSGRVDTWVSAVYINDYPLSGFDEGDTKFNYRLSEEYESISNWENSYKVYYESNGEKKFIEEIVYIYETDTQKLKEIQDSFFRESTPRETPVAVNPIVSENINFESLDDTYFYNSDGKPFTLKLLYAQTDSAMEKTALTIQTLLETQWIVVEIQGQSLGDITSGLRNESLNYDIMLIGINLGYFDSDIFPYFHSSQVQNGYNFSNFKKLSLDILLEELKSNNLTTSKSDELKAKMLEILKEENILKVLYTPEIQLLVDKNIKNFSFPNHLPDNKHRYYPILDSYLIEKKIINTEEKWVWLFLKYLYRELSL